METTTILIQKLQLYVGLDVHKHKWSVTVLSNHVHHATFSQQSSPEVLKLYMDKHFPGASIQCAYEAGKFGYWIQRELESYGYDCMVINPADIPTTSQEKQNKTDRIDSRKIANTLRAGLLRPIHVPSIEVEGDRQLFRYRKRLWSDLVRIKNRIKDKLLFSGIGIPIKYDNPNWSHEFVAWLKQVEFTSVSARLTLDLLLEQYELTLKHFLKVSCQVRKLQRKSCYKQEAKLLRAIPGIGPLTTVQLLTEIEDVNRFPNFKQFNSYVGLKPTSHSSGENDWKGHLTNRRHNGLRSALIESAWTARKRDPALLLCYEELLKRTTGKRAIVIIARKLLSRIYHVLKTKASYELGIVS